jgi:RNA polymerase sigma-70 factor (ECF subfamily)
MFDVNSIIKKMNSGDTESFREIIMEYAPALRAFLASRLFAKDMVEDIAQDTFIAAYENINKYDKEQKFIHWLLGIASNKLKNHYRSTKIHSSAYEKMVDIIRHRKQAIDLDPDEIYFRQNKKLHQCIEALPDKARALIKARYFENTQVKQLAELQKTTELALSALLFRTRQKLAECMEKVNLI